MDFPDTSAWLALALASHPFHGDVVAFLKARPSVDPLAFCRSSQQSYLRLLTTQSVVRPYGLNALTSAEAWESYERLEREWQATLLPEPEGLQPLWKGFTARPVPTPKLWMDAYLAAFAIAGGHRLVTTDQGFAQFPGLNCLILPMTA